MADSNGQITKVTELTTSQLDPQLISGIPSWTRGYKVRCDPEGRLYLYLDKDGADIFVVPHIWGKLRLLQGANVDPGANGVQNYGIDIAALRRDQIPDSMRTNDPAFRPPTLSSSMTTQSHTDTPPPTPAPATPDTALTYLAPAIILAVAVALGFVARRRAQ